MLSQLPQAMGGASASGGGQGGGAGGGGMSGLGSAFKPPSSMGVVLVDADFSRVVDAVGAFRAVYILSGVSDVESGGRAFSLG